jgi:hypothetical protein
MTGTTGRHPEKDKIRPTTSGPAAADSLCYCILDGLLPPLRRIWAETKIEMGFFNGLLVEENRRFGKVHDLQYLLNLLLDVEPL